MTWVRIDDGMPENWKIVQLSDAAFRAHIYAICYCARQLTDGFVPETVARRLAKPKVLAELMQLRRNPVTGEDSACWTPDDGGIRVHDYEKHQDKREKIEAKILANREKASAGGKARAEGAAREGGRFAATPPAQPPAKNQRDAGKAHQPTPAQTQIRSRSDPEKTNNVLQGTNALPTSERREDRRDEISSRPERRQRPSADNGRRLSRQEADDLERRIEAGERYDDDAVLAIERARAGR